MDLLDPRLAAASLVGTALIYIIIAFFTRAGLRRCLAALAAAIPIIPMLLALDTLAARMGWWHYPAVPGGTGPLVYYVAAALGYGAAFGLIGWRVVRRWAASGLVVFVLVFAVIGVARDLAYALATGIIQFGKGPLPLLVEFISYSSAALLVQLLMYWIAGPARSDALRRMPQPGKKV